MGRLTVGEDNGRPVELYYEDHGSGPPVVHGNSDAIVPFEVSGRHTAESIDGSN